METRRSAAAAWRGVKVLPWTSNGHAGLLRVFLVSLCVHMSPAVHESWMRAYDARLPSVSRVYAARSRLAQSSLREYSSGRAIPDGTTEKGGKSCVFFLTFMAWVDGLIALYMYYNWFKNIACRKYCYTIYLSEHLYIRIGVVNLVDLLCGCKNIILQNWSAEVD